MEKIAIPIAEIRHYDIGGESVALKDENETLLDIQAKPDVANLYTARDKNFKKCLKEIIGYLIYSNLIFYSGSKKVVGIS